MCLNNLKFNLTTSANYNSAKRFTVFSRNKKKGGKSKRSENSKLFLRDQNLCFNDLDLAVVHKANNKSRVEAYFLLKRLHTLYTFLIFNFDPFGKQGRSVRF